MSPWPERMTDHWWWRPGVRPFRRMYVWHILFADQPEVIAWLRACQSLLTDVPGLDPVPPEWLHMTTQVVGFVDEITEAEAGAMADAAARRLRRVEPIAAELGSPLPHTEGVVLGVQPGRALDPVRAAIREAVAETVRAHRLTDESGWTPHLSIAYSNREGPAAPVVEAMRHMPGPVEVRVGNVHLVGQERVGRLYRWDRIAVVPLGATPSPGTTRRFS